jgi:tetratricopeptide (TPR) repeat protein
MVTDADPVTLERLGDSGKAIGSYQEAISAYRLATKINITKPLMISLSQCLQANGEYNEALQSCKAALNQDRKDVSVLKLCGEIHVAQLDYSSAIEMFQNAIRKTPDDAELYEKLGVAYRRNGAPEKALKAFQAGLY